MSLLTYPQAAAHLNISDRSLRRIVEEQNKLPEERRIINALTIGKRSKRFAIEDLDRYIDSCKHLQEQAVCHTPYEKPKTEKLIGGCRTRLLAEKPSAAPLGQRISELRKRLNSDYEQRAQASAKP